MKANLVFVNFPLQQLSLTADLPDGALGDVLNRVLRQLHVQGRLPGLQQIEGVSTAHGVTLDASCVIRNNGLYHKNTKVLASLLLDYAVPDIHIHCTWDEKEVRKQGFRIPLTKPIERKLITNPIKVTPDVIELMALASSSKAHAELSPPVGAGSSQSASTLSPSRLQKLRVYFSSAISEGFDAGDPDYIDSVVAALNVSGVRATRLVGDSPLVQDKLPRYGRGLLTPLDYREVATRLAREEPKLLEALGLPSITTVSNLLDALGESAKLATSKEADKRERGKLAKEIYLRCLKQGAVGATRQYILQKKQEEQDALHVLHIQSRLPDSGSAFNDRELLERFKEHGIKVIVTVHEFKYNLRNQDDPIHNVPFLNECCVPADRVVFLNERDLQCALDTVAQGAVTIPESVKLKGNVSRVVGRVEKFNLKKKARHIPVAITVPAQGGAPRPRPEPIKIILFGMIRPGKGDKSAIQLAKRIAQDGKDWRVVVAGKVASTDTLKDLLLQAFGNDLVSKALSSSRNEIPKGEKEQRTLVEGLMEARKEQRREFELKVMLFKSKKQQLNEQYEALKIKLAEHTQELSQEQVKKLSSGARESRRKAFEELRTAKADADGPKWNYLPIDVYVNVSKNEANALFQMCKYAYKEDEKGLADNASSIISCVANGCITFTKLGKLTPKEFQTLWPKSQTISLGEFQELQFKRLCTEGRFESKNEGGFMIYPSGSGAIRFDRLGFDDAFVCPGKEDEEATPDFVIQEILRREHDSRLNARTLDAMRDVIQHRFWPLEIARNHCLLYLEEM